MSDIYTHQFKAIYKQLGSKMPIDVWAEAVGKKLPYFSHDSDVYNPITVDVRVADGPDGVVRLNVARTEKNWYDKLQQAISEMIGQPVDQIVDYVGDNIANFTYQQLINAGELDAIVRGKEVRLAAAVPPPKHMATDKLATIASWYEGIRDELTDTIASTLAGKTMPEIAQITVSDGQLQKNIESKLAATPKWDSFLHTMAMDDVARNSTTSQTTQSIAKSVLHQVRSGLTANEMQIRTFHAHNASKKQGDAPLWSQNTAAVGAAIRHKDEYSMYQDIAEDAVYHPILALKVGHIIYRGVDRRAQRGRTQTPSVPKTVDSSLEHPMDDFYHNHYYKTFGKFPGHVLERFNARKTIGEAYPGDHQAVKDAFCLFSNRFVGKRHTRGKGKKGKKGKWTKKMGNKLPELVPLVTIQPPKVASAVPKSAASAQKMPKLVPIVTINPPIGKQMPKLVPLGKQMADDSREHKLVPIGKQMPKLVPLGKQMADDSHEHKLVPLGKQMADDSHEHKLVPIGDEFVPQKCNHTLVPLSSMIGRRVQKSPSIADQIAQEGPMLDPVFGMPTLASFLPKRK